MKTDMNMRMVRNPNITNTEMNMKKTFIYPNNNSSLWG